MLRVLASQRKGIHESAGCESARYTYTKPLHLISSDRLEVQQVKELRTAR
jgi:hypothetical protein